MNELPNQEPPDFSSAFDKMAERIRHNKDAAFGGACVIIPPTGGAPLEVLILDSTSDLAQFYSTIATRLQIALETLKEQNAAASAFGRR